MAYSLLVLVISVPKIFANGQFLFNLSSKTWSRYFEHSVELLARERRSLDILSVKKEARLSAKALAEVDVGRGEEDRDIFTTVD